MGEHWDQAYRASDDLRSYEWTRENVDLLWELRHHCMICGRKKPIDEAPSLTWITPIGRGGTRTTDNALLVCRPCFDYKNGYHWYEIVDRKTGKRISREETNEST